MSGIGASSHYTVEKFRHLNGPILDIRSPKEFEQGHWPGAFNLPLFTKEERAAVGTTYNKEGQKKSILLGLNLVAPKLLRLKSSLEQINKYSTKKSPIRSNKIIRLYCWRGGMRSRSIAWLAKLLSIKPIVLQGGYKNYRNWVLQQFEKEWPFLLIGGKTGTGKTDLLHALSQKGESVIDLEGLANHRGSSFGSLGLREQPSTEHYENLIAEKLDSFKFNLSTRIYIEAESSNIGKCRVPIGIYKQMKSSPILEISRPMEERLNNLIKVYGNQDKGELALATNRISRRLGPQRTKTALKAISDSNWEQACRAMLDYYDRCYDFELKKAKERTQIDISGQNSEYVAEKIISESFMN